MCIIMSNANLFTKRGGDSTFWEVRRKFIGHRRRQEIGKEQKTKKGKSLFERRTI
jgi:hypothetical protein